MTDQSEIRRLAVEILSTLANVKRTCADRLLRPAGVDEDLIRRFLTGRDEATNEKLSKRVAGTMVLDVLTRSGADADFVARLVGIAAAWEDFHLAADEYRARAVVEKAKELHARSVEDADEARSRRTREASDREARATTEAAATRRRASALLLAQFDHAAAEGDPHARGFLLQDLLNRVFDLHGFTVSRSYTRNAGGEQIDGAFEMEGWHYLVECRWRAKPADVRDLDGLRGQLDRSGRQTMGVFLSINGWSENVVPLLKQSSDKSVILMDGYDLRAALAEDVDLRELMRRKVSALNLSGEPFHSAAMRSSWQGGVLSR